MQRGRRDPLSRRRAGRRLSHLRDRRSFDLDRIHQCARNTSSALTLTTPIVNSEYIQWAEKTPDWAQSLPQPKSNPAHISVAEVAELIRTKKSGVDFIVVDTRKADWDTNYIRTAINLPAQSFHQSLPGLLPLLQSVPLVIFHCQACSLVSRGSRAASWYQDALDAAGITTSQARILTGGIRAWAEEYGSDEALTVKIPAV